MNEPPVQLFQVRESPYAMSSRLQPTILGLMDPQTNELAPLDVRYRYDLSSPWYRPRLDRLVCVLRKGESARGRWTDALFSSLGEALLLVSARVRESLVEEGIERFWSFPVRWVAGYENRPPKVELPEYHAVVPDIGLEVATDYRGSRPERLPCRFTYIPRMETWSGADLFRYRIATGVLWHGCTRRVLELARRERWTGFEFEPIDKRRELSGPIKYLAKKWPPKSWHPEPPGAGKPFEEWLRLHRDPATPLEVRTRAYHAIREDYPDEAAEYFLARFHSADRQVLEEAAQWIFQICNYVSKNEIPPGVLEQARAISKEVSQRRERRASGSADSD